MLRRFGLPVALSIAAACGGPSTSVASPSPVPSIAAPSGPAESANDRMARLYEAAKAEKQVNWYSSLNTEDAKVIIPKFETKFPGVKVEHTRSTGEQLVTRLFTEIKSGQFLFDVFDSSSFQVKQVVDAGFTQPYRVASVADIPKEGTDDKDTWIANRGVPLAIGFNTAKGVKPGDIKGWADLCDKKYEGKIAVEIGDTVVYSALRKGLGEAEAQRILKCVAANKPSLRQGHTEIDNLLPAGEFSVTFASHSYRLAALKYEKNQPVDWVKDTIIMDLAGAALAAKPPHPNAAKLFMEWMVSPEGQLAVTGTGRPAASTKTTLKYPDVIGDKRIYVTVDLQKDFERDDQFWRLTFGIK